MCDDIFPQCALFLSLTNPFTNLNQEFSALFPFYCLCWLWAVFAVQARLGRFLLFATNLLPFLLEHGCNMSLNNVPLMCIDRSHPDRSIDSRYTNCSLIDLGFFPAPFLLLFHLLIHIEGAGIQIYVPIHVCLTIHQTFVAIKSCWINMSHNKYCALTNLRMMTNFWINQLITHRPHVDCQIRNRFFEIVSRKIIKSCFGSNF